MGFDLAESYKSIRDVLAANTGLKAGIVELIVYCESQVPSDVWESLRSLDFETDVIALRQWLEKVLSTERPKREIEVFWFGLFNPVLDNGQATCGLYVSGSTNFDLEDETGDWAGWTDDSYLPERRYANSQVLHNIYSAVAGTEAAGIGEYVLCLGYACMAIRKVCEEIDPSLLIGDRDTRAVAVGFDSGDFIVLGSVGSDMRKKPKAGQ